MYVEWQLPSMMAPIMDSCPLETSAVALIVHVSGPILPELYNQSSRCLGQRKGKRRGWALEEEGSIIPVHHSQYQFGFTLSSPWNIDNSSPFRFPYYLSLRERLPWSRLRHGLQCTPSTTREKSWYANSIKKNKSYWNTYILVCCGIYLIWRLSIKCHLVIQA